MGDAPEEFALRMHASATAAHEAFHACKNREFYVRAPRKWAKSTFCFQEASLVCWANPFQRVPYAAPTKEMVKEFIIPVGREVMEGAPKHLRAEWRPSDASFVFPNGSRIVVAGCDGGGYKRLRGPKAAMCVVDEAAFIDELDIVLDDVLLGQVVTTGGRILIVSTPADTPEHPFTDRCRDAARRGFEFYATIYDATHIPMSVVHELKEKLKDRPATWRREYLAEHVVDMRRAVIPEFTDAKGIVVAEHPRPEFFEPIVSIDIGFSDLTVCGFGYYDFRAGLDVIEDELVFEREIGQTIADAVHAKEEELWGRPARDRVCDAPLFVVADMSRKYGLSMSPPRKDDKEAAITAVRTRIKEHKIRIHPRCKTTISHLEGAVWNRQRTDFERSKREDGIGHYDGVDMTIYFVRTLNRQRDPYPPHSHNPLTHHLPSAAQIQFAASKRPADPQRDALARVLYPRFKRAQ